MEIQRKFELLVELAFNLTKRTERNHSIFFQRIWLAIATGKLENHEDIRTFTQDCWDLATSFKHQNSANFFDLKPYDQIKFDVNMIDLKKSVEGTVRYTKIRKSLGNKKLMKELGLEFKVPQLK